MQNPPSSPPKPLSQIWRPELTRLPPLHLPRRIFRALVRALARLLIAVLTRATLRGIERLPRRGPAILVVNHLGDADAAIALAALPVPPDVLGKIEILQEFPMLGRLMDWYGTIWLHRGRIDRRALDFAVQGLEQGRVFVIAPEGRYSLIQGLEKGGPGAAYLAARTRLPLIPIALTGTRNSGVYGSLRRWQRPQLTLTVGDAMEIAAASDDPKALREATEHVMRRLAAMLPPGYRGVYSAP